MLRLAVAAIGVAVLAVGFGSTAGVGTGTVACSTTCFAISFDPTQRAVGTSSGQVLASARLTSRSLAGACRRIGGAKRFLHGGPGAAIRRSPGLRRSALG